MERKSLGGCPSPSMEFSLSDPPARGSASGGATSLLGRAIHRSNLWSFIRDVISTRALLSVAYYYQEIVEYGKQKWLKIRSFTPRVQILSS